MRPTYHTLSALALAALALAPWPASAQVPQGPPNAAFEPAFPNQTRAPQLPATEVDWAWFAEGLERPWGIAPLPDGSWLVSERPGRLRMVAPDGSISAPISGLPEIDNRRQGGLLDVMTGPDFASDRMVYFTYAKPVDGGVVTAAGRGMLSQDGTALTDVADIFVQSPPSSNPMHYGARILFAPDGQVFVTTGEHSSRADRVKAQDVETTYGKVIRITPAGNVPSDNPFVGRAGIDTIWSLGHRNIQGAAIGPDGALWTIEHGPAGGDELNRPGPGLNYGWPEVSYGENYNGSPVGTGEPRGPGFEEPVYYWDPVIAPGGMLFYDGALFGDWQGDLLIAGLNPGALVRLRLEGDRVVGEDRLLTEVGRIRDVEQAPDGSLLLLIDDSAGGIIRVTPSE